MSNQKIFRQCIFTTEHEKTTGWIEEENAVIGRRVSFKDDTTIWVIQHVSSIRLNQEEMIRDQNAHKNQRIASDV